MKKVDIFYNGHYLCSTLWANSCKAAKSQYLTSMKIHNYWPELRDKGKLDSMDNFNADNLKCNFGR